MMARTLSATLSRSPIAIAAIFAAIFAAMTLTVPGSTPSYAGAAAFQDLVGNWRGRGWVTLNNGGRERVQCRVKYNTSGSDRLRQDLRCASTSYKIDAVSDVVRRGDDLSGRWSEKSFDVQGTVSGRAVEDGFTLTLTGNVFNAGMSVKVDNCRQDLNIRVHGIDIKTVSMALRKC